MTRDILISGILGGVVMFLVTLAFRVFLPGFANPVLRIMPGQVQIHAALKERITEPGTYVCPYLPPNEQNALFPNYPNEPIFAVNYKGLTHATVPGFASVGILAFLLAPMTACWLLSQASTKVLAKYSRRVLYIASLGLFVAVAADLLRGLTEDQTFPAVAAKALATLITWVLVGMVLAWRIKPRPAGFQG